MYRAVYHFFVHGGVRQFLHRPYWGVYKQRIALDYQDLDQVIQEMNQGNLQGEYGIGAGTLLTPVMR